MTSQLNLTNKKLGQMEYTNKGFAKDGDNFMEKERFLVTEIDNLREEIKERDQGIQEIYGREERITK